MPGSSISPVPLGDRGNERQGNRGMRRPPQGAADRMDGIVANMLAVHLHVGAALLKALPGGQQIVVDFVVAAVHINGHNFADVFLSFQQRAEVAFVDFLPALPNFFAAAL